VLLVPIVALLNLLLNPLMNRWACMACARRNDPDLPV
jgi:hypothetical protein